MNRLFAAPFPLGLFYAAAFLYVGVHLPFWPVWLASRGVEAAEIGILLSAAAWIRAVVPPLIAHGADRRGERKRVIVLLLAATCLAYLAYTGAHGFWPLLAVGALAAACFSAVIPLGENLAMLAARQRGFDYGRVRLWGSLTFIAGAAFGGRLLAGRPDDLVLWLVLAALALTLAASFALPDVRPPPARGPGPPSSDLLRNRVFVVFLCAAGLIQASHAAYYGFATLHWRAAGLDDGTIGALWAEGVVAEVALFAFSGAVVARLGPLRLLGIAAVAGILRWSVLGLSTDLAVLAAVQLLHAATFAAAHLAAMHFLQRAIPAAWSATAQSLYAGFAMGVAMGLAMIAAGQLYAAFGGAAFHAMAAMAAAGGGLTLVLARMWSGGPVATQSS